MIDIKCQPILPTAYDLKDLFEQHWEEVYGTSKRKANILLDVYGKMEEAGLAFGLFAYFDMAIVGYSICFIAPNIHCAGHISCNNDALYVDPLFRDTSLGLKLIRKTESMAKSKGADLMCWNAPLNTNLIKILPRLKYEALEQVFIKEI
jgi:GNAT superfamily N-acetyltransferase